MRLSKTDRDWVSFHRVSAACSLRQKKTAHLSLYPRKSPTALIRMRPTRFVAQLFLLLLVGPWLRGSTSTAFRSGPRSAVQRKCKRDARQHQDRTTTDCYPMGTFGMVVKGKSDEMGPFGRLSQSVQRLFKRFFENKWRLFHLYVFMYYTYDSIESIRVDSWEAERNPEKFFGKTGILKSNERDVIRRRVGSSRTIRKLVGAGYTPRLVWLFGVMLRGIIHCTALPKIFEPTIGWGAGCVYSARFAYREWIPVIMLGWFGSQYYWKTLFGVDGPPNPADVSFDGLPITIHKVYLREIPS